MTQWEQLKKEYREIPVPEDGQHQVLKAMAEAKKKRSRSMRLTQYGTVAVAVLLVVLLLPGMLLFSGGFGDSAENAYMEADYAPQNTDSTGRGYAKDSAEEGAVAPTAEAPSYSLSDDKAADYNSVMEETEQKKEFETFCSPEKAEAISREILRQMEERMQNDGETYYRKGDEYPEGFEQISNEQEYYVNADGLLVIVFQAGVVAPKEQGAIEFIIPAEVVSP